MYTNLHLVAGGGGGTGMVELLEEDDVTFTCNADHIHRWSHKRPDMFPQAKRLSLLLDEWHATLRRPNLGREALFDALARTGNIGFTTLVDVTADDPGRFRSKLWGSHLISGDNFARDVCVKDLPKVLSKWVQAEYLTCKVTGVPNFQEITWSVKGEQRDMYRLLLPLSLDSGSIDHLVSSVVYKKPALYESLAYVKA
ncbi:MAG: hypothetical protein JNL71_00950 [Rhodospirillales bacterium]|nr:hypothetical protein [Rhodospirillales bacterium]